MPSIYLSYRREDGAKYAARLRDHLADAFGTRNVLLDIDFKPGVDFKEEIQRILSRTDVMLVLLSPRWASAQDSSGKRRIDDSQDFVRREIATALNSGIVVIPVLVGGAAFPRSGSLPQDIQSLLNRHGVELPDHNWDAAVTRLIVDLSRFTKKGPPEAVRTGHATSDVPRLEAKSKPPPINAKESPRQSVSPLADDTGVHADCRDIFISYAEEDSAIATGLAAELRKQHLSTWMYEEDGVPGISHLTQVFEAIESCRALVLIASATSVTKKNVIREVEAAHDRDKMIIPVRTGLTHDQFTGSNTILRMATGTAVSSSLDGRAPADIAKRIANALRLANQRART